MPRLTLEQFLKMPETEPASEYVCGRVFQKPMPDIPHSAIQFFLATILGPYLKQTGWGRGFTELRCIFGPPGRERTYIPDLTVVARSRIPSDRRHLYAPPDMAIEILSPDEHRSVFLDKIQFYLQYGVRLVWVIDPETSTISVQAPGEEPLLLERGDVLDGGAVLPGFSVSVDEIFDQMQV